LTVLQDDTDAVTSRKNDLLDELNAAIRKNLRSNFLDRAMHQVLLVLAVLVGFIALAVGQIFPDAGRWAGMIGAVPSVAAILIHQLNCIKAQNWHARMADEMDGIKARLLYELPPAPSLEEIAVLSRDLRNIKTMMTAKWETIMDTQSPSSFQPTEPSK
jgi:hypothetical protein